jgi:hypothetical protein
LKQPPGAARAEIVAPQLLNEIDVAMDATVAALHVRFGRIGPTALRGDLKSRAGRRE